MRCNDFSPAFWHDVGWGGLRPTHPTLLSPGGQLLQEWDVVWEQGFSSAGETHSRDWQWRASERSIPGALHSQRGLWSISHCPSHIEVKEVRRGSPAQLPGPSSLPLLVSPWSLFTPFSLPGMAPSPPFLSSPQAILTHPSPCQPPLLGAGNWPWFQNTRGGLWGGQFSCEGWEGQGQPTPCPRLPLAGCGT